MINIPNKKKLETEFQTASYFLSKYRDIVEAYGNEIKQYVAEKLGEPAENFRFELGCYDAGITTLCVHRQRGEWLRVRGNVTYKNQVVEDEFEAWFGKLGITNFHVNIFA